MTTQVSDREGGRKSQYKLSVDETTLAGVITAQDTLMLRYVTRISGDGDTVQDGDEFKVQYKSRSGVLIYEGVGELEIISPDIGKGSIELTQTDSEQIAQASGTKTEVWVIWSMVRVKRKKDCPDDDD